MELPGYRIVRELGQGGMASVYLAEQIGLEREVALKIMAPALAADPSFGERFLREAKIVAKLNHPAIVVVHEVGIHENYHFIAMEYHSGDDLKDKIAAGLEAEQAINIVKDIAKALHYAHEKGYVHRDIKPENILFRADNTPVLSDFGIAKATNSTTQMTQSGSVIGTPRYMSPEQARGKPADGRADLYSLGIIFYEMLTGKVPYDAEDSVAIGIKHITDPIPTLTNENKKHQFILDKFLAKDPKNRFQTGMEIVSALNNLDENATQVLDSSLIAERIFPNDTSGSDATALMDASSIQTNPKKRSKIFIYLALPFILLGILILALPKYSPFEYSNTQEWLDAFDSEKQQEIAKQKKASQQQIAKHLVNAQNYLSNEKNLEKMILAKLELMAVLKLEPNNLAAKNQLSIVDSHFFKLARDLANEAEFEPAYQAIESIHNKKILTKQINILKDKIDKAKAEYDRAYQEIQIKRQVEEELAKQKTLAEQEQKEKIQEMYLQAITAEQEKKYTTPKEESAYFFFQEILKLDPEHEDAQKGLKRLADHYIKLAQAAKNKKEFTKAESLLAKTSLISSEDERIEKLRNAIVADRKIYLEKKAQDKITKQLTENREKVKTSEAKIDATKESKQKPKLVKKKTNPVILIEQNQQRKQNDNDPEVKALRISMLLNSANKLMQNQNYLSPPSHNALEKYRSILAIDAKNNNAIQGVRKIFSEYQNKAKILAESNDTEAIAENKMVINKLVTEFKFLSN